MGEIADLMIEGSMCSHCGVCFVEEHGYPVLCKSCYEDETEEERAVYRRQSMKKYKGYKDVEGVRFYSVTTVLNIIRKPSLEMWRGKVGNAMAKEIIDKALKFGREFHEYCDMINQGKGWEIDVDKLEEPAKSMSTWFRDWFFENVEKVILSEKTVYNKKHGYYGRPDAVYLLKGKTVPDLVDVKTSAFLDKDYQFQLSAYKEALLADLDIRTDNRIIIQLPKKTGKYRLVYLDKSTHETDFLGFIHAKELYKIWNQK